MLRSQTGCSRGMGVGDQKSPRIVMQKIMYRAGVKWSLGLYPCYNASFVTLEIVIKVANLSGGTTQWFVVCIGVSNAWCRSIFNVG